MTGPIQRRPLGYLAALDLKSLGKNPAQASDFVQPVYDIQPHYESDVLTQVQTIETAVTTSGTKAILTVPTGIAWYVHNVTVSITVSAGAITYVELAVQLQLQGSSFRQSLAQERSIAIPTVGQTRSRDIDLQLVLPPGSQLSCLIGAIAGGGTLVCTTSAVAAVYSV